MTKPQTTVQGTLQSNIESDKQDIYALNFWVSFTQKLP